MKEQQMREAEKREKSRKERYEPPRGKTNNVVFEQVQHKPGCTSAEDG